MLSTRLTQTVLIATFGLLYLGSCTQHDADIAGQNSAEMNAPTVSGLETLFLLSDAKSRSISPENLTGGVGMGDRTELEDGSASKQASKLGKGWKVNPYIVIEPHTTLTMGTADGPGVINHVWMTLGKVDYRNAIFRIYWDDETTPSVESPVGDFFASGWGQGSEPLIDSRPIIVNAKSGFNSYWQMPFRRNFRISMENTSDEPFELYYQIDYSLTKVPANAAYFHAQFRMANPVEFKQPYTIIDGIKGKGHYVGTYLGHAAFSPGWWGEGEVKFYMDGDTDYPTINGTGEEDYFLGSYSYIKRHENGIPYEANYSSAYAGFYATRTHTIEEYLSHDAERRYGQYRWHIVDPIRFESDLKVTIQNLGWERDGVPLTAYFLPLQDYLASVAYWYQTEPHNTFPALPGPEELSFGPYKGMVATGNNPELVHHYNTFAGTAEIVMLGDSITHLANWAELLPGRSALNRGISGDKTSDVLARLEAIEKAQPRYIFLMIGVNDIFQGVDVETVEHNIRDIVGQLTAFATTRKVFLQSTLPCNSNLSKACASMLPVIDVLNRYLVQFAQSSEKIQFLDLVPAMSDTDGLLSVDYTYDGTHLTSAAYKIWVMELNRVLEAEAR